MSRAVAIRAAPHRPPAPAPALASPVAELLRRDRARIVWDDFLKRQPIIEPFDRRCRFGEQAGWSERQLATRIDEAKKAIVGAYSMQTLWAADRMLEAAATKPAKRAMVELLAAVMVDSWPQKQAGNLAGYLVALVDVVDGENRHPLIDERRRPISKYAIGAAIQEARRTLIWAPAPVEFLTLCRDASARFANTHDRLGAHIWVRWTARPFLKDLGEAVSLPDDQEHPDAIPF